MNLIRTADGFLTNLSQVAPKSTPNTREVYLLNPGSNTNQRSLLRIVNTTGTPGSVTITAADDNGDPAPGSPLQGSRTCRSPSMCQKSGEVDDGSTTVCDLRVAAEEAGASSVELVVME